MKHGTVGKEHALYQDFCVERVQQRRRVNSTTIASSPLYALLKNVYLAFCN